MLSAFKLKRFAATMTFACAGFIASVMPASADEQLRAELDQMLINIEDVQTQLQGMGYGSSHISAKDIAKIRADLAGVSDASLIEHKESLEELLNVEDALLDVVGAIKPAEVQQAITKQSFKAASPEVILANAVPTTTLSAVDTESLELESCLDQVAATAAATPLREILFIAESASEVLGANINVLGNSAPNPFKVAAVAVKLIAKQALLVADEIIRFNALCKLRVERKIAREYIQARQVRYTPHKIIEAKFDVVRPVNLGGNKKYRYTFWMHLTKDGRPTNATVTKVMASQLSTASDNYVTLSGSQYTVVHAGEGLYKLTLDTPADQGLNYVRGFVLHLEQTLTSPGGATYKHYGVAHIRSDENSKTF